MSIFTKNVAVIHENATVDEAAQMMQEKHVGSLVVVQEIQGKRIPIGIITDRDIALSVAQAASPKMLGVSQIMARAPMTASITDGIYEIIAKMKRYGVKRLPLVDMSGALVGIVSADDLLHLLAEEISALARIQESQFRREEGLTLPTAKQLRI